MITCKFLQSSCAPVGAQINNSENYEDPSHFMRLSLCRKVFRDVRDDAKPSHNPHTPLTSGSPQRNDFIERHMRMVLETVAKGWHDFAQLYLVAIGVLQRGIVLLHDTDYLVAVHLVDVTRVVNHLSVRNQDADVATRTCEILQRMAIVGGSHKRRK